jgi:hypothetical protein
VAAFAFLRSRALQAKRARTTEVLDCWATRRTTVTPCHGPVACQLHVHMGALLRGLRVSAWPNLGRAMVTVQPLSGACTVLSGRHLTQQSHVAQQLQQCAQEEGGVYRLRLESDASVWAPMCVTIP